MYGNLQYLKKMSATVTAKITTRAATLLVTHPVPPQSVAWKKATW